MQQSTSNSIESEDRAICGICRRQVSRYTCPACNMPYCSLSCFRSESHGQCSESFYKKELESEIRTKPSASMEERRQMMEMLKKFEQEDEQEDSLLEDEDDGSDDLAKRLSNVDLDSISTSELWELLSVEERNKFLGTIKDPQSGPAKELLRSIELDIGNVLPWWDADESIPSISSKRYGKRPEMVRIPTPLLSRPVGPDSGPPLLYNICVVLTAYAYITRHLGVSPLSAGPSRASGNDNDDDNSVASTARHLFRALAPFISDKRSRVLFTSMDAVVADMWPRLIESGKANRTSFVLFLRDASNLLVPRRIAEVEESPVKSGSELGSDQEEGEGEEEGEGVKREKLQSEFHKSDVDQRDGLLDNAARSTLLVLSDLINLFRSRRGSENQERETPASAKLIFYAGHIASIPAPILAGFSAEVSTRARALEAEGEIQVGLPHSGSVVPVVPERSPSTKKGKERTLIEEL